ncbi:MAG: hypothetical protein VKK32_02885 [Candidatus Melainabacteria bacterium]|nr:hypothetical protein [Candidatus Melainabacteria bacterium]
MTDFPGFLPPSGLSFTQIKDYVKTIPDVNDPKTLEAELKKADKNGDAFVSTGELRELINASSSSPWARGMFEAEQEWGKLAGKEHLKTLSSELNKPETLRSAKVTSFLDAAETDSSDPKEKVNIIQGTVNLGGKNYEFDLANRQELALKLRDDEGNLYTLTNDDIPPAFLKDLISKRPPNNPQPVLRYSSIFNSRFCSVEK